MIIIELPHCLSIVLALGYNVDAIDGVFEDASLNLTLTSISRRRLSAGEVVLKEKPLLTLTTPHTPKTLAKYVAELRQKVGKCLMMTGMMIMVFMIMVTVAAPHTPKTLAIYVATAKML